MPMKFGKTVTPDTATSRDDMVDAPSVSEGTLERLRAAQADIREEYLAERGSLDHRVFRREGQHPGYTASFRNVARPRPERSQAPVHVLCNDTLVESPVLMAYIDKMLDRLQTAADNLQLPIKVMKTRPYQTRRSG